MEEEPDILAEMEMYSDWGEMITRALWVGHLILTKVTTVPILYCCVEY